MNAPSLLEPLEALGPVTPGAGAPARNTPWAVRLVETASSYLPVLLMALLALGTWLLVKNTPLADAERSAAAPRHEPDYTMQQFSIQRYTPEGPLRAQIEGDVLRHYPDTDTVEIDNPRVKAYGPDGRITLARARHALANGDASEVQLQGAAQVTREATATAEALQFNGEFLHAFLKTEQVRSHLPVTVTRGGTVLRADTLAYDNLDRTAQLKGRVRASFAAPGAKSARPAGKP